MKILPEVTGMSCVTSLANVDLPQPDSPTRPSVSPWRISKLTPSTAFTDWPRPAGKCFTTFSTRTSGFALEGLGDNVAIAGDDAIRSPLQAGRRSRHQDGCRSK